MATGAYGFNLFRGRYLLNDKVLAWMGGLAASENVPAPIRSIARGQFLDGMYTRELVKTLDEDA